MPIATAASRNVLIDSLRRGGQGPPTEVDALPNFLHRVGSGGNLVFQLHRSRNLPLVLLHHLKNLFDRRLARSPREVQRTVFRRRSILEMEARDAIVVLLEELHRRAA